MADRIFRSFTLSTPSVWRAVFDFVKAFAQAAIDREKPLVVIVTTADHDATDAQRGYWHGVVLKRIAEEVNDEHGHLRSQTYWHETLVTAFLGLEESVSESGKIKRRRRSTARGHINVGDFASLIDQTVIWAAHLGVEWD